MNQWGLTDRGNVRAQNQDYFTIVRFSPEHALAVVCDGMGGAKSGNVASRLSKQTWPSPSTSATAGRISSGSRA